MGHPKFARPKTQTPTHPWKAARIEEEHALKDQFGLKKVGGMREIWREKSALRRHRNQAMKSTFPKFFFASLTQKIRTESK